MLSAPFRPILFQPKPRPIPRRLSERKYVTLIAAFRCKGDGAVLCADSQESWGAYKTSVTKLQPQRIGDLYQLAYAGSGLGDLVDGLGDLLETRLAKSRASGPLSLQRELQKILVDFYKSPAVRNYPADPTDPNSYVSGVVCIRVMPLSKVFLFKFSKTIVLPVKDFVLRGMEEPIYQHIAQRLYRRDLLPLQARLLGLHLLTEAASTSNQIGPPMRVVAMLEVGVFADDRDAPAYVRAVANIQAAMDDLLLACADTHAVSDAEARKRLRIFSSTIIRLLKEHTKDHKRELLKHLGPVLKRSSAPKQKR